MSATPEMPARSVSQRGLSVRRFSWWKLAMLATVIAAVTLWISSSWLDVYLVTEQSMWPTLSGGEDRILVNKLESQPKRRWQVWLDAGDGTHRRPYVKRLIGLPHEWVDFRGGDIWIGTEGKPCQRATRPAEVVEAQRIPIYPSWEGRASEDCFDATQNAKLKIQGESLWLESSDGHAARVNLLGGADSKGLEPNLHDDHLSLSGAHIAGTEVVPDIRIDLQISEVSAGAGVSVMHALASGSEDLQLEWKDGELFMLQGRSPHGFRRTLPGGPFPLPLALRLDTLDGIFTISTLRRESDSEAWTLDRVLHRGDRNTADHGAQSQVSLSVDGRGSVRIDALRVTRDVHWTWPLSRRGQAPAATADGYFLLGDNSPVSQDSRHRGPTPEKRLMGRVQSIIWPLGQKTEFP